MKRRAIQESPSGKKKHPPEVPSLDVGQFINPVTIIPGSSLCVLRILLLAPEALFPKKKKTQKSRVLTLRTWRKCNVYIEETCHSRVPIRKQKHPPEFHSVDGGPFINPETIILESSQRILHNLLHAPDTLDQNRRDKKPGTQLGYNFLTVLSSSKSDKVLRKLVMSKISEKQHPRAIQASFTNGHGKWSRLM